MTTPVRTTDRREEILEVATRLFSANGYAGTTLDDIAAAIGFTKPAIYYWFRSKDAILYEIHDRIVSASLQRVAEIRKAGGAPQDQLRAVLESHVATLLANREANEVLHREQHELSPARRRSIRTREAAYETELREIHERGVADGSFRPVDSRIAVGAVLGAVNWMYRWYRPRGEMSIAEVTAAVTGLLERGVLTAG